ncbi:unnamed protein product [Leuciscus chuanchicus]
MKCLGTRRRLLIVITDTAIKLHNHSFPVRSAAGAGPASANAGRCGPVQPASVRSRPREAGMLSANDRSGGTAHEIAIATDCSHCSLKQQTEDIRAGVGCSASAPASGRRRRVPTALTHSTYTRPEANTQTQTSETSLVFVSFNKQCESGWVFAGMRPWPDREPENSYGREDWASEWNPPIKHGAENIHGSETHRPDPDTLLFSLHTINRCAATGPARKL